MSTPARFHVGPAAAFKECSRQLVRCGSRNVTVYFYKGQFYALDNACYHHGGPLLEGDIEEMGGHPCVVCPWHQYHIALDTGEGLYWTLHMSPTSGVNKNRPKEVASKGRKQRTHVVTVEDGEVFVTVDTTGPRIASDAYAEMPLANREETMTLPMRHTKRSRNGGGNINTGIHSSMRSGRVFAHMAAGSSLPPAGCPDRCVLLCVKVEQVCDGTKEFYFDLCQGKLDADLLVPGQFVDLQLPVPAPVGKQFVRRWTVIETNKDGSLFTLMIKAVVESHGGSAWMFSNALRQRFPLVRYGGSFTLTHHMDRLRAVEGRVVILTAGIGITPCYASLRRHVENPTLGDTLRLSIVHLHVDRTLLSVVKLEQLMKWHYADAAHFTYRFHCYLTQQQQFSSHAVEDDLLRSLVTCGRRPDTGEIGNFLGGFVSESSPALAFVCGPPTFVRMGKVALLSHGMLESDVLTDEEAE